MLEHTFFDNFTQTTSIQHFLNNLQPILTHEYSCFDMCIGHIIQGNTVSIDKQIQLKCLKLHNIRNLQILAR